MQEEPTPDSRVIRSYIRRKNQCFLVLTEECDSSDRSNSIPAYNKTLVWKYDFAKMELGDFLGTYLDLKGSLNIHFITCVNLYKEGKPSESRYYA